MPRAILWGKAGLIFPCHNFQGSMLAIAVTPLKYTHTNCCYGLKTPAFFGVNPCLPICLCLRISVCLLFTYQCLSMTVNLFSPFFHSLISFQTVSTHTIHISAWCFLIAMFLLPHAISLDYTHFTCGPSLLVFLFLSVSLMEHLPAHTFLRSCPLLTHLSIHTCLSACVCVCLWAWAFIGKAKTVCHASTPVRPRCSPPLCVCVCVLEWSIMPGEAGRCEGSYFFSNICCEEPPLEMLGAPECVLVFCACMYIRGSYLTVCWLVMAGVSLCPGCRLLLFVMRSNSFNLQLLTFLNTHFISHTHKHERIETNWKESKCVWLIHTHTHVRTLLRAHSHTAQWREQYHCQLAVSSST